MSDPKFKGPAGSSADLVFGASDGPVEPTLLDFYVDGTAKRPGRRGSAGGTLIYDPRVSRPVVGSTGVRFQQATPAESGAAVAWENATHTPVSRDIHWQAATQLPVHAGIRWQDSISSPRRINSRYQRAWKADAKPVTGRWQDGIKTRQNTISRYQRAWKADAQPTALRFQKAIPTPAWFDSRYQRALRLNQALWLAFGYGAFTTHGRWSRYQDAIRPPPGIYEGPEPPVIDPCYIPPPGGEVHLLFKDGPGTPHLVYVCETHDPGPEPGETIVIPVKEVYVILNEASLSRVDGNIPLRNFGLTFGIDTDSWTWNFSATLPGTELANLEPGSSGDPVIVQAVVNGVAYRMIIESIARERTFGQTSLRVTGRGINAVLDSPYAPVLNFGNTGLRTAQQLMGDVLSVNGVPMDWTVDWGLEDWNVPGGIWTYQGSYMGALSQIVNAAGGYLQPDRVDQNLIVLPRYPHMPWNWASNVTPDYEVPDAFAMREGIEWLDKPVYNRVFASGTAGGVLRRVTRAGSDGGLVAPTVVDSLITDGPAGRQRGGSILADTGRQARVTLRMPVPVETGLILPGKFVRYMEGSLPRLGLVRSMSVEVGNPEIMQTLTLETHLA